MQRLGLSILVVFLSLGGLAFADESHNGSLVGAWMTKVQFVYADGFVLDFRYLQTFNADGIATGILPDPGPGYTDGRSACVGEWKAARHSTFDVVTWCLESQELTGWLDKISAHFTMSSDGTRISDPHFRAEWWLGETYQGIGYGSMEAVRITGGKH